MASRPCGSTRGHGDEQPETKNMNEISLNQTDRWKQHSKQCKLLPANPFYTDTFLFNFSVSTRISIHCIKAKTPLRMFFTVIICKAVNNYTRPSLTVQTWVLVLLANTTRGEAFNIKPDSDSVKVLLPAQNELHTSHICMASLLSGCECESWG